MEGHATPCKILSPLMAAVQRICLVTPSHLAMNPRLVKEANALAGAGYRVHVIGGRFFSPMDALDSEIIRGVAWTFESVDCRISFRAKFLKLVRCGLRFLGRLFPLRGRSLLGIAHSASVPLLASAASAHATDLYIGHCVAGLAAVRLASQRTGTPFSFDVEDFHAAETKFSIEDPVEAQVIDRLLRDALRLCRYITAASPLIADETAKKYSVPRPTPILNVFPLSEAPTNPEAPQEHAPLKIYWFSQTIGSGRGLEDFLPVIAAVKLPCELHLRGIVSADFHAAFEKNARQSGFSGKIEFHPIASQHEMARLAAHYSLGLSVELAEPRNRDLCLTNKIFTYLLAGIPVALTPTSAQQTIAPLLGEAALMLNLDDPQSSALQIDELFGERGRLIRAKQAAWNLGQQQFNWDKEKQILLALIGRALSKP